MSESEVNERETFTMDTYSLSREVSNKISLKYFEKCPGS
jgi:hypothetical protein